MNVVPLTPNAWREYPHVVTRGDRYNVRWRIVIRRDGPPADDVYSYVGDDLLDLAGRLTAAGRETISRDVARRARATAASLCVVWSKRSATWFDRDGTARHGFEPPRGDPIEAAEYRHVPATLQGCDCVALPERAAAPYLCVTLLNRDYVEIALGDRKLIAHLDEPPADGDLDPAEGMLDLDGRLVVPKTFRGISVREVRNDWSLYGDVQPIGRGIVLRCPWPEDVREACEEIAGCELAETVHDAVWRAIDPEEWGAVRGTVRHVA